MQVAAGWALSWGLLLEALNSLSALMDVKTVLPVLVVLPL